jgi:hypothetical protein
VGRRKGKGKGLWKRLLVSGADLVFPRTCVLQDLEFYEDNYATSRADSFLLTAKVCFASCLFAHAYLLA